MQFEGKTAVVTGASRGIGEALARHFADKGVSVVLAARSGGATEAIAAHIRGQGRRALALACDVTRYEDVRSAVETCVSEFGRLDILVNNAGVIEPVSRLAESDPHAWGLAADINYKGVYHGLRAAIPVMQAQGGGVIVNVSSGAAVSALEGWSHYCSSKAAALSLTRCAHTEYAGEGVRVVGLSPGTVATQMQVEIRESGVNPVSRLDPSAHIPPEWVAHAVAWLCTDDAREFDGTDFSLAREGAKARVGLPAA